MPEPIFVRCGSMSGLVSMSVIFTMKRFNTFLKIQTVEKLCSVANFCVVVDIFNTRKRNTRATLERSGILKQSRTKQSKSDLV